MRNQPVRVFIMEPHRLMRAGLRATLGELPFVDIVGESDGGPTTLDSLPQSQAHVVLADMGLCRGNDWQLLKDASLICPKVIILADEATEDLASQAVKAGAYACADKAAEASALGDLLLAATRSRSTKVSEAAAWPDGFGRSAEADLDPRELLSRREMEIFRLTGKGREAKQIAEELDLSPRTVDVHRNNIRNKLGIRGTHELMRFAMEWETRENALVGMRRFREDLRPLLLVEDDAIDILSVKRAMREIGRDAPLVVKRNGEEALEYLRERSQPTPFLVVLDLKMPRMSGHELLREIRRDPKLKTLPVVAFTGSREEADIRRMHALHLMGYFVKPSSSQEYQELFSSLARFWSSSEVPATPPSARSAGG